jgi:hypothetical protein
MVDAPGSVALTPPRGGRCQRFLALMVGTPGFPTPPSRGATIDVFYVDGGHSRSSVSTRQGPRRRHFYVDGGYSRTSVSTSQGARHQHFLPLMVGAPGSLAPAPPSGPTVDLFYVDGGCSQTSISTYKRAHHRHFLC